MDAIFFVLRNGCQWNALNATAICSSSSAHRRFQEWTQAGVFERALDCRVRARELAFGSCLPSGARRIRPGGALRSSETLTIGTGSLASSVVR